MCSRYEQARFTEYATDETIKQKINKSSLRSENYKIYSTKNYNKSTNNIE